MRKITNMLVAAAAMAVLGTAAARADELAVATAGPMTGNDAAFGEHHSAFGHDADIVMVLGPVHSHKEHCSSSLS